tara:strand:- start:1927 stop:2121 length:195 start_codon:yes stop_codon:yes gene_type:complete
MTARELKLQADQTIASWGVPGLSYKLDGKFAVVTFKGQEHKCMKFNLLHLLNSLAVNELNEGAY